MKRGRRRAAASHGSEPSALSILPVKSISPVRERARALGIQAEKVAAAHLSSAGIEIVAVNVRVGRFEIDILAREGSVLVIVEVRARSPGALVRALDSVDAHKRARLRAAGTRLWRDRFSRDRSIERVRFDCVAISIDDSGEMRLEHVRAAF